MSLGRLFIAFVQEMKLFTLHGHVQVFVLMLEADEHASFSWMVIGMALLLPPAADCSSHQSLCLWL